MRTLLGNLAMTVSLSIAGFLLAREMQYWTRAEFNQQHDASGYKQLAPHWNLDAYGGHVPGVLTWIAVIAAFAAVLMLIGRWRLVVLGGGWLFMGLVNTNHFFAPGAAAWFWIVIAACVAIVGPMFIRALVPIANKPRQGYDALAW